MMVWHWKIALISLCLIAGLGVYALFGGFYVGNLAEKQKEQTNIQMIQERGMQLFNADANSPIVTIQYDNLTALLDKAQQLNITTIYAVGNAINGARNTFLIIDNSMIGYEYTSPIILWANPFP